MADQTDAQHFVAHWPARNEQEELNQVPVNGAGPNYEVQESPSGSIFYEGKGLPTPGDRKDRRKHGPV